MGVAYGCGFILPQALPKGISALKNLKVLDLEGNKLEYLATEISRSVVCLRLQLIHVS